MMYTLLKNQVCEKACNHDECEITRVTAHLLCFVCREPIGFDVSFSDLSTIDRAGVVTVKLVHTRCQHEQINRLMQRLGRI